MAIAGLARRESVTALSGKVGEPTQSLAAMLDIITFDQGVIWEIGMETGMSRVAQIMEMAEEMAMSGVSCVKDKTRLPALFKCVPRSQGPTDWACRDRARERQW